MSHLGVQFAIGWEPELRGLLTVIIGVVILCGSVYGILATNVGFRLSFLVSLAAIMGWMLLMGIVWMIYGIGLVGPDPSWKPVPGEGVLQGPAAVDQVGLLDPPAGVPAGTDPVVAAEIVREAFLDQGWVILDKASPAFGQAQASAAELLVAEGALPAGEFEIVEVFDIGGERFPKIGDSIDFIAFWHRPHYVVAEAAPYIPVRTEPGRAPVTRQIDETRNRQYVYMVRDHGAKRQPAQVLTVGSALVFAGLCFILHRRERFLEENLAKPLPTERAAAAPEPEQTESERVEAGV